jgi:hypothetical protein
LGDCVGIQRKGVEIDSGQRGCVPLGKLVILDEAEEINILGIQALSSVENYRSLLHNVLGDHVVQELDPRRIKLHGWERRKRVRGENKRIYGGIIDIVPVRVIVPIVQKNTIFPLEEGYDAGT